jgi:tetratricopeptide (TPR) repeat protein
MATIDLNPYLLLLLVACLYALIFGGLSILRREGLSVQFAVEVAILTVLFVGGSWLLNAQPNPILFLIVLYLVTMRSRLAVDVANMLVRRRNYALAFKLYQLALAWWPDASARLIVMANKGAAEIQSRQVDSAIETLESVLQIDRRPRLGLKYEAATLYNLAYAYEQKGDEAKATIKYNEAIEFLPDSLYAQASRAALKRMGDKRSGE